MYSHELLRSPRAIILMNISTKKKALMSWLVILVRHRILLQGSVTGFSNGRRMQLKMIMNFESLSKCKLSFLFFYLLMYSSWALSFIKDLLWCIKNLMKTNFSTAREIQNLLNSLSRWKKPRDLFSRKILFFLPCFSLLISNSSDWWSYLCSFVSLSIRILYLTWFEKGPRTISQQSSKYSWSFFSNWSSSYARKISFF